MNSEIQVFNFQEQEVRVTGTPDKPWFVALDVCRALGLGPKRITESLSGLDDDEKAEYAITVLSSNGTQQRRNMITVNLSGLYALIFNSRKPQARAFRKWVTSVVIPEYLEGRRCEDLPSTAPKALPFDINQTFAEVLGAFVDECGPFKGTAGELACDMYQRADPQIRELRQWPRYPNHLGSKLNEAAPVLAHNGLDVSRRRSGKIRLVVVERNAEASVPLPAKNYATPALMPPADPRDEEIRRLKELVVKQAFEIAELKGSR